MNLPNAFVERTEKILSSEFSLLQAALNTHSPVSIRLNRLKTGFQPDAEVVPWCQHGFYLKERPGFTFDPLFHAGAYYVQEASSMFLEQAINQWVVDPSCVLDLCAAPGGKSTHLRSLLPDDCLVVSNEIIRNRSHILVENLMKWGHSNIVVTNNNAEELGQLTHLFDAIVVDAPCSGEGMFRKDPPSMNEWSVQNVLTCAARQQSILDDIWEALRPGGILIYSTCTYNLEENEQNVSYLVAEYDAEALPLSIEEQWGVSSALTGNYPGYRFFPHKTKGEGFFLAVLRKSESSSRRIAKPAKNKSKKEIVKVPEEVKCWLKQPNEYHFEVDNGRIFAVRKSATHELTLLQSRCHMIHKGILMGEIKGKDVIPHQSLALSNELNRDCFENVEVDFETVISYLRNEALSFSENTPKGYLLINYKDTPLGWVKNIGSRANNLYPHEWRIRSSYLPDDLKSFW